MKKIFVIFLVLATLGTTSELQAQDWEVGGWLGGSHYFGDINANFKVQDPYVAGGAILRYNFNNRLSFKLSANVGKIGARDDKSPDAFQQNRNLSFTSRLIDGTAQFEFNFMKYEHGSNDNGFTPYILAGISIFHFNPRAEYEGEIHDLQPLGTEGQFKGDEYYLTQPAIAYGGGFKFDLNYSWSVNLELSTRRLFTDYLDDVSTQYPDLDNLDAMRGEIAVALSDRSLDGSGRRDDNQGRQRGDSQKNDTYVFLGIGLVYNFARIKCFHF